MARYGRAIRALEFSHDGQLLITAHDGNPDRSQSDVHIWNVATGQEKVTFRTSWYPTSGWWTLDLSHDDRLLAVAGADERVHLWDVQSGQRVGSMPGGMFGVAFSPDDRLLAATADPGVRLYELPSGRQVACLGEGESFVYFSLAFAPDRKRLVAGEGRGDLRVWDLTTRQEVLTLKSEGRAVRPFFPTGDLLFTPRTSASDLLIWRAANPEEIRAAEKANRP